MDLDYRALCEIARHTYMCLQCDFQQENRKFNFRTFQINFSYSYIARTYTYECTIRLSMGNRPNNIKSVYIYNKLYWFFHITMLARNSMVPIPTCDTPIHVIICNIILYYLGITVEYYIFYFITEYRPSNAFCTHNVFSNNFSCDAVQRLRIYFIFIFGQFNLYRYLN